MTVETTFGLRNTMDSQLSDDGKPEVISSPVPVSTDIRVVGLSLPIGRSLLGRLNASRLPSDGRSTRNHWEWPIAAGTVNLRPGAVRH
jgi:hypothetical protein